jgi:hypothetical protein
MEDVAATTIAEGTAGAQGSEDLSTVLGSLFGVTLGVLVVVGSLLVIWALSNKKRGGGNSDKVLSK